MAKKKREKLKDYIDLMGEVVEVVANTENYWEWEINENGAKAPISVVPVGELVTISGIEIVDDNHDIIKLTVCCGNGKTVKFTVDAYEVDNGTIEQGQVSLAEKE